MKNNAKKTNKKVKAIMCGATILGVIGVSGIFAYLTDTDTANNRFTIGEVKIELYEPKWDGIETNQSHDGDKDFADGIDPNENGIPDKAENLSANAEIEKDPQIKNTGKNPAYVFMKVKVPKKEVITAGENGEKNNSGEKQSVELFTYTISNKWTDITSKVENEDEEGYATHIYYYNDVLEPIGEGETATKGKNITEPLFEKVKFANIIEDQLVGEDVNLDIKIDAYAIQSDNLPAGKSIEEAYTIYINQNSEVKE